MEVVKIWYNDACLWQVGEPETLQKADEDDPKNHIRLSIFALT